MNHTKILKRALEITTNYRVLWVFGIILALTAGGVGGSSGGGSGGGSHGGNGGGPGVGPGWPGSLSQETITGLIIAGVWYLSTRLDLVTIVNALSKTSLPYTILSVVIMLATILLKAMNHLKMMKLT